jgi:lipopolysaccharide/colanic/teichoic acid biosynthesis glycosyltransferase
VALGKLRALDIIFSLMGILLLWPLFLLIALVVRVDSKGPAFFVQERLGHYRRPFRLIKFRTMVVDAEKGGPQWAASNDKRVTRIGRFLRRSRIDELPQLFNVLKGDLSFVGPRPIRAHFATMLESHDGQYRRRFDVKPGVTGWAQIYAPYGETVEDQLKKLPYDLLYHSTGVSCFTYFKLIFITLRVVCLGSGQ